MPRLRLVPLLGRWRSLRCSLRRRLRCSCPGSGSFRSSVAGAPCDARSAVASCAHGSTVGGATDKRDPACGGCGRPVGWAPMLPPDNHVHSEFSWDTGPRASLLRACERAVEIGLPALAFTEHLDFTVWDAADRATAQGLTDRHPANQLPIDVDLYAETIWEARGRHPQLRIWSGVEAGEPQRFGARGLRSPRTAPVYRALRAL